VERKETITSTLMVEKPCDRCLVGSWTATPESLVSYFRSVMASNPDTSVTISNDVGGSMYAIYLENGLAETGFNDLTIKQTIKDDSLQGNPMVTEIHIIFNGAVAGRYTVSDSGIVGTGGASTLTAKADTFVNGAWMGLVDLPIDSLSVMAAGTLPLPYECSGNTLTTWPPVSGIVVSPIVYTRNP